MSEADLAQHDRLGNSKSRDGRRKKRDQIFRKASHLDMSDHEDDDRTLTREQPVELPDFAFGSDGVYHSGPRWDLCKENLERAPGNRVVSAELRLSSRGILVWWAWYWTERRGIVAAVGCHCGIVAAIG